MAAAYGVTTMTRPLRRVLVRPPSAAACRRWREFGWCSEPDAGRLTEEHDAFCAVLEAAGADVVAAAQIDGDLDAIYAFDPALATEHGAILLRPGKQERRGEPEAVARELERASVPIHGALAAPALAEGGDFIRLDEATMLAGVGYRTNSAGVGEVERLLPGVDLLAFDLPHWRGEAKVMHLLSLLSPLDDDLVVAYPPLLPVRLAQLFREREIQVVPVPDDEFETMGTNVLALEPRVGLALDGNPVTRKRLEHAGVDVSVYSGRELSLKGDGGPTCLTMPLMRA
jgi:N-dimethylarginine dimethylaminohydrolase